MKDQETKERFIEVRARGWSFDRIAKELKVSKQTLIGWSKELAIEIANLKAIELEALREKFFLLKEQRIEIFGQRLKAIKEELERRDFADVPTEKLYELLFKLYAHIGNDTGEVIFHKETDGLEVDLAETFRRVKTWAA